MKMGERTYASVKPSTLVDRLIGRIIKGVAGQYTVDTAEGRYVCSARGLFRKNKISPIVGDMVKISAEDGYLLEILPRKNELRRPKVANVDQIIIVLAAAQPELSFGLLDRYLMQAEHEIIPAAICINKLDLKYQEEVRDLYTKVGYPVFCVSAITDICDSTNLIDTEIDTEFDKMMEFLQDKTTVLAGPSGVGKSSIINRLCGSAILEIGEVSEKIGRGKHTTRHTEFVLLPPSAYVIDTPGFSSLDPPSISTKELAWLFREFRPFLGECKFKDCLHYKEQDCAVKGEIGNVIDKRRYERYIDMIRG